MYSNIANSAKEFYHVKLYLTGQNLVGINLANPRSFAKFENISHRQSFPPYGKPFGTHVSLSSSSGYTELCCGYDVACVFILVQVDTEVCEQPFPGYQDIHKKMTKRINQHVYSFILTYICHLHNNKELIKLRSYNYM